MLKEFNKDKLNIKIFKTREEMGKAAAKEIIKAINKVLTKKDEVNIIFGAAPSQKEMFKELIDSNKIAWQKINAFHMDEYIGLDDDAPQLFANFLNRNIFHKCPFKKVYYLKGHKEHNIEKECLRYAKILKEKPVDISLVGIGENGHIAFNDPHVADFKDKERVKVVTLDEKCRIQQVNDGCFRTVDEVPLKALTLTIPALMNAEYVFCTVPAPQKCQAVTKAVLGEIDEECPASILRKKTGAKLFLDRDSGVNLL